MYSSCVILIPKWLSRLIFKIPRALSEYSGLALKVAAWSFNSISKTWVWTCGLTPDDGSYHRGVRRSGGGMGMYSLFYFMPQPRSEAFLSLLKIYITRTFRSRARSENGISDKFLGRPKSIPQQPNPSKCLGIGTRVSSRCTPISCPARIGSCFENCLAAATNVVPVST